MTTTLKILQEITTGYSIFEKDQVLTERQLNSVTDYLNDQTRLGRIYLLGVGVVFGLRVSLQNNTVIVTKGIGITTDGDLLYYSNETVFDRFLEYDKSYPQYAPFYVEGNTGEDMIPVYELIRQGATEPRSPIFSLSEFTTQTTKELNDMVAVLLMESYVNDPDLCTGTDCDNLGQDCINTPKLLLVDKASINLLLKPSIPTPDEAFSSLNEIVADRPLIPSSISSVSELAQIYLTVCTTIHNKLLKELPNLYLNCAAFLADVFSFDPTNAWNTRLTDILTVAGSASRSDIRIQYYYDFLKDVVETYNQFRDLLFGDTTWCCPDLNGFPKHLILGNLVPNSDPDENRTAFYPSPMLSQTKESLNHAKFLAHKLDTLIQTFQMPEISVGAPIRITPSLFEDQPLEERAIPYYYQVNTTNPIHKSWNYRLHQRGMDLYNYSYNADFYLALGGAAQPIASQQIGRFTFFRIEGYLGQSPKIVREIIFAMIRDGNLPFSVIVAKLGQQNQTGVVNLGDLIDIEHFGGVVPGGTLVLLADSKDKAVIADFMLPRYVSADVGGTSAPPAFIAENQFSPSSSLPGKSTILSGSNFNVSPPTVFFGSTIANVIDYSASQIVVTVPQMSAGSVKIMVQTIGGIAVSTEDFNVENSAPVFNPSSQFSPKSGRQNTEVTLFGSNFDVSKATVQFGTTAANVLKFGFDQIVATVPQMSAGSVKITVQTIGGIAVSTEDFNVENSAPIFNPSPQFSPSTGRQGIAVTLFGSNFDVSKPTVQFGTTDAGLVSYSASQIVAMVPTMSAGKFNITVQTRGGTVSSTDLFNVESPAPVFNSSPNQFSPRSGLPGTVVTLFGSNFNVSLSPPTVLFGSISAKVASYSTTQIVATVPTMSAGKFNITVQTTGGTTTSTDSFTVSTGGYYGSSSIIGGQFL